MVEGNVGRAREEQLFNFKLGFSHAGISDEVLVEAFKHQLIFFSLDLNHHLLVPYWVHPHIVHDLAFILSPLAIAYRDEGVHLTKGLSVPVQRSFY